MGGVGWEESFPYKEYEVHEGTELDFSLVAGALADFTFFLTFLVLDRGISPPSHHLT